MVRPPSSSKATSTHHDTHQVGDHGVVALHPVELPPIDTSAVRVDGTRLLQTDERGHHAGNFGGATSANNMQDQMGGADLDEYVRVAVRFRVGVCHGLATV